MNMEKISYIGIKVFLGIDVHRQSYSVAAVVGGIVAKKWSMRACPIELCELLKKHFEGAKLYSAYEAGFSGFSLHRHLVAQGINNIVVNASSIEISSRDRVKTDKRDSLKLGTQLYLGRLKGIRVPTIEEENRRSVTRTRAQLVRSRSRIMNQIRMKLLYYGVLPIEYRQVLKRNYVECLIESHSIALKVSVGSLCSIWESLDGEIKKLAKELRVQREQDPLDIIYRSIPGIGPLASRILSNELGDMSQFPNEKALFSFTGLTPMEFSSGENRRLGHISRQGNSFLRGVLVECAWKSIKHDPVLQKSFNQIASRAGKKRAIVAIARKLVGRARAVARDKKIYEINYSQAA